MCRVSYRNLARGKQSKVRVWGVVPLQDAEGYVHYDINIWKIRRGWEHHVWGEIPGHPLYETVMCNDVHIIAEPIGSLEPTCICIPLYTFIYTCIPLTICIPLKPCSHGLFEPHWMHISSIHINPHKINAHWVHIRLNPPPEVVWMHTQAGLHYLTWFIRGYAYHEIICLLACGVCYIATFCSSLAVMLGKKEAFFMAKKSGIAW